VRSLRRRPWRDAIGPLLLLAAYAALAAAWIFSNPTYAAPDEWAHFVRAASIGNGQLIGEPPTGPVELAAPPGTPESVLAAQERWVRQNTRVVSVPRGRFPPWTTCSHHPAVPATCLTEPHPPSPAATSAVATGAYQPLPYLLPALASRIEADPDRLARLMRTTKALLALALLAAAVAVLWVPGERGLPALGVVVAVTPMVLFLGSSLNPSGVEIAAAIAFFSCLLRLSRGGVAPPSAWLALGLSGFVLALSRAPAPLWIVLHVGVIVALAGVRPALRVVGAGRPLSLVAGGLVAAGVVLNRLWERLYGPEVPVDPTPLGAALRFGWGSLAPVLREQVGVFNHLEFGLGRPGFALWFGLVLTLVALALRVGTRRERIVLAAAFVAMLALPVVLAGAVMRHTGYGLQGRYVMAFSVVVPLLAGEILYRRRASLAALGARSPVLLFAGVAAVVHGLALYVNAKRFAVGQLAPDWFYGQAAWGPPGGWRLWGLVTVAGAALLVLAAALEHRRGARPGRRVERAL
jgi:FtsH-binding integral membrane protein